MPCGNRNIQVNTIKPIKKQCLLQQLIYFRLGDGENRGQQVGSTLHASWLCVCLQTTSPPFLGSVSKCLRTHFDLYIELNGCRPLIIVLETKEDYSFLR